MNTKKKLSNLYITFNSYYILQLV